MGLGLGFLRRLLEVERQTIADTSWSVVKTVPFGHQADDAQGFGVEGRMYVAYNFDIGD